MKAGGGQVMTIGTMLRQWLVKLEWFSTLFPRVPVPIQQKIQRHLEGRFPARAIQQAAAPTTAVERPREEQTSTAGVSRERFVGREDVRREFLRDDRVGRNEQRRHHQKKKERKRSRSPRRRSPSPQRRHHREKERDRYKSR